MDGLCILHRWHGVLGHYGAIWDIGDFWDRVQIYKSFLPSISHFRKVDIMEES